MFWFKKKKTTPKKGSKPKATPKKRVAVKAKAAPKPPARSLLPPRILTAEGWRRRFQQANAPRRRTAVAR